MRRFGPWCILEGSMTSPLGYIVELDPSRVKPFADQPRKRFLGIAKLAESIRTVGQVTPILVTDCADPEFEAELVDGERRLRACLQGGMKVRAIFDNSKAEERHLHSMAANFCRQAHDAVEIMEAVLEVKKSGRTEKQIAAAFGKSVTWVAQHASLQRLSPAVLDELKVTADKRKRAERLKGGRLTFSLALLLVPLPTRQQLSVLGRIKAGKMSLAQARTFVRREAGEMGVQVGRRQTSQMRFQAVHTAVKTCSHVVDRYLDMPGSEINALVRGAMPDDKRKLKSVLDGLCERLLMLSDALGG